MKVLAVGDIHTKTWIFDLVESVIDDFDSVVFCGDYADNFGAEAMRSILTWERLRELCMKYPLKVRAVKGNHDYIYTVDTPTRQSGYNSTTQFLLDQPQHAPIKRWVSELPLILTIDNVWYAHGGIDERWDGSYDVASVWQDTSPIWVRPQWAQYKNIKQVVGHTPQKTVNEVQPGIWLIDTFSQHPDGRQYGDGSMLVITDGQKFEKININANHRDTSGIKERIPR